MKILRTTDRSFKKTWSRFLERSSGTPPAVERAVRSILEDVRCHGDRAILRYTKKFDHHHPRSIEVSRREISDACRKAGRRELVSLKLAASRIRAFHLKQAQQLPRSWKNQKAGGLLGEQVLPIERVGIYVPGGLAAYPSTVLMNAIPAKVAGVREIVMVSPWTDGKVNPYTLIAADLAGVDRIFKIGGAQAIAAMAYGTKSVPSVDKIVGPGNIFVATAKRLVFGKVGIDTIAGPSEIVVIANDGANPEFIASDLLSQAEHDPQALSILLTSSEKSVPKVKEALSRQLQRLKRRKILEGALQDRGIIVVTRNDRESVELSDKIAPEHLSLQVKNAKKLLARVRNAGAIFIGAFTPVAFGDYIAGPNHVLPTAGSSRFSSPLGVGDFLKRSSVIGMNEKAFEKLAPTVIRLANLEGLTAHAASVEVRAKRGKR